MIPMLAAIGVALAYVALAVLCSEATARREARHLLEKRFGLTRAEAAEYVKAARRNGGER